MTQRRSEASDKRNSEQPTAARPPLRVRARLRAATLCDEDTIARWWSDRGSVRAATDARLSEAARSLGIAHPSDAPGGSR